jgi:DNA-binding PadR family transcriptional regulator
MAEVLGPFEQAVLLSLVRPSTALGKEAYGRAVLKEVELRLDRSVSAGAVYSTLDRLEQKGLISSELRPGAESRSSLQRRCYTIEPSGIRALNEAKAAVDKMWSGVRWPLKGAHEKG